MIKISIGQYSHPGPKGDNEDFFGVVTPEGVTLETKGVAVVIADGLSGSGAGREAAELAVKGFLTDYFATPESWSVKTSTEKVLTALNRWLYERGQAHGAAALASTLSILVLKSTTAHLFHVGDSRIGRLRDGALEWLTHDHRVMLSGGHSYLNRAIGIEPHLEVDYRTVPLEVGDVFVLTTDGVHDFLPERQMLRRLRDHDGGLDEVAVDLVEAALAAGGLDNATCQLVRVAYLPLERPDEFYHKLTELPFAPELEPGMVLDGYRILEELQASKRSQVFLAEDPITGERVVLKTPSVNFEDDAEYIEHFILQDWVARRINSLHVLRAHAHGRKRTCLYSVSEYVHGITLREWMEKHPQADLEAVRKIIEQIADGLRAFHRLEMLHRDLKPENIMVSADGIVKIIDFGSVKIAGLEEIAIPMARNHFVGTLDYAAPEYHVGHSGTSHSDLYALGTLVYEMLTGCLPYEKPPTRTTGCKERYVPAFQSNPMIPLWIDGALEKATACDPRDRYETLSEFLFDLSHPNPHFMNRALGPLLERNPVGFWLGVSVALLIFNLLMLYYCTR